MKAKILLAYDGSELSMKAVRYVAGLLAGQDVFVTLFHVLAPVPPSLREHGGAENPAVEAELESEYVQARGSWEKAEIAAECSFFGPAWEEFKRAGFDDDQVFAMNRVPSLDRDITDELLLEARERQYDTIVLGRKSHSHWRTLVKGDLAEKLVRHAKGYTVWIVE